MALISTVPVRVEVPHEPGQWFEFRRLAPAERRACQLLSIAGLTSAPPATATPEEREDWDGRRLGLVLRWVKTAVVGWSYDVPFTAEACDRLDETTLVWASFKAFVLSEGLETLEEKKVDSPGSTASLTGTPTPGVPTSG